MFTVIIIMLCGVLAGRVTGMRCRPAVSRVVTALIWILLFMLGVEVGADRRITGNVLTLGLDALAVAAGSVVGCVLFSWVMWRMVRGEENDDRI